MIKVPQQIIPLIILFLIIITALFIARDIFIPDTFGDLGHYRANAVSEITEQEIVYAGTRICIDCHDDISELKSSSNHRQLSCEVCHGPGGKFSSAKIMNRKKFKADPELQKKLAHEAGLIVTPDENTCKKCHNERSPHYEGFDFKARYEEVKHKNK